MKFEYLDLTGLGTLVENIKSLVASIAGKVTHKAAATTKAYITGTTSSTDNTDTQVFDPGVYLDTTAGQLVATTFKGNLDGNAATASTATKLGSNDGTATKPVYFSGGKPVACTYELNKTVPSNAVFTDTVYTHPSHTAKTSGLYKITVDALGHVSAATAVAKSDITGLGIPAQDTVYTHPSHTAKTSGLYKITVDALGHVSAATAVAKADITGLGIPAQDTTYSAASTTAAGLMSAADKTKLDGIAAGANAYSLPTASSSTLGGVKTTSTVTSTSGLTACPIISGVPYYKDTNTTYTLSSFGVTATAAELNALDGITATVTELNYCDGVTSNIQTQLNSKLSTTGKAASATVADSANAVAWANVTGQPSIPAVTKVTFTATDSRWGTATDGKYPLTIAASGGEFLNCYRTNGSVYDKMDVSVTVSGNNIIIYSLDKFAGYMTYLK